MRLGLGCRKDRPGMWFERSRYEKSRQGRQTLHNQALRFRDEEHRTIDVRSVRMTLDLYALSPDLVNPRARHTSATCQAGILIYTDMYETSVNRAQHVDSQEDTRIVEHNAA